MSWIEEVRGKYKRKNQILFSKDNPMIMDLDMLLREQNRKTIILWAFDLAEESIRLLSERYPGEERPLAALQVSRDWAYGKVKMSEARKAILSCHSMAKELVSEEDKALCHAVGQACSCVHTVKHALGYPIYELTALVRRYGIEDCVTPVETRKQEYVEKILYWNRRCQEDVREWAKFITDGK